MRRALLPLALLSATTASCKKEEKVDEPALASGTLTLDDPAPAAWVVIDGPSQPVTASGTATHVTGVTVNGATAALSEEGAYTANIELERGINVVEATAVDERGDTLFARNGVIAGAFGNPDASVSDAISVRVNQSGLDKMSALAAGLVDADTVNAALPALNPVMSESILGIDFTANVNSLQFSTPRIAIVPSPGNVTLTVALPDLAVDLTVYADAGWLGATDFGLGMTASSANISASLIPGVGDGKLALTLTSATVDLQDFAYTLTFLPSWITDYAFVDTIRDQVESLLVDQISTMVPPLLDETLAGLAPSISTDLLGRTVTLAYSFADIESDADGLALTLDLDVDFPDSGDHTYKGFLTAPYGEPTVDHHADLAAAISDDLLNVVVFEAWRSGLLELTLSTDDGSLDPALLSQFKADSGTISTWAALPPVVVERDGGLVAQLGELIVTVDTPGGELGDHLVVAVDAEVPLGVRIEGGTLQLDVGTPALTMMVRESDWGASDDTVTNLIQAALPLDSLLSLLGALSFDLPTLYGIAFDEGTAARDDDGVHTDAQVFLR